MLMLVETTITEETQANERRLNLIADIMLETRL